MKTFRIMLVVLSISLAGTVLYSCGSKSTSTSTEKQGKEYTSEYICPMHCEGSGSDSAGTCPVCKMDYVQNDSHEGHNH
ncbi:MAG: hypothetical protein ACI94Y_003674 [Maribacter sp.]|jgi:hypothetical protein